jgi:RimJ/RimL family protein N-acetyltransferase
VKVCETARLILRWLSLDDDAFVLELVNDPAWLRYIGDRGVRTLADARNYIVNGPVDMYHRLGFGLFLTERKTDGAAVGLCGLIKRDTLDHVDLGFAFLPQFLRNGYAFEAASAVMEFGKNTIRLSRIVAITSPANDASVRLLEKLGMTFEKRITLTAEGNDVMLYAVDFPGPGSRANLTS